MILLTLITETSVDPSQPNQPGRMIQPINEEAVLQDLAAAASVPPQAIPPQSSPLPINNDQHADNLHASPMQFGVVPTVPFPVTAQPIYVEATIPSYSKQTQIPPPQHIADETQLEANLVKTPWLGLAFVGIVTMIAYIVAYNFILNKIVGLLVTSLYKATNLNITILYAVGNVLEYLLIGFAAFIVGNWLIKKLTVPKPALLVIVTIITASALVNLFYSTGLIFSAGGFLATSKIDPFFLYTVLSYGMYALSGALSILIAYFVMKLLLTRIKNEKLYVFVIIAIFSIPLICQIALHYIQAQQLTDSIQALNTKIQTENNTTKQNLPSVQQTYNSSSVNAQSIAYKQPQIDGSGVYNDGNITFTYPRPLEYPATSKTKWSYSNKPAIQNETDIYSPDYAYDSAGIITKGTIINISFEKVNNLPKSIKESYLKSNISGASYYDIPTTDGSYAFGSHEEIYNRGHAYLAAHFIKNSVMYTIQTIPAQAGISVYKPQFDIIVSSFRFVQ